MKSNCTVKNPPVRVNGYFQKAKTSVIERDAAAKLLRACRQKKVTFLKIYQGRYSIVPDGLANGFVLTTR